MVRPLCFAEQPSAALRAPSPTRAREKDMLLIRGDRHLDVAFALLLGAVHDDSRQCATPMPTTTTMMVASALMSGVTPSLTLRPDVDRQRRGARAVGEGW